MLQYLRTYVTLSPIIKDEINKLTSRPEVDVQTRRRREEDDEEGWSLHEFSALGHPQVGGGGGGKGRRGRRDHHKARWRGADFRPKAENSCKLHPSSSYSSRLLLVWTSTSGLLQVSLFISSFIIGLKVTYASIEAC